MNTHKIHIIAGARPNFMKIAPIVRALQSNDHFEFKVIHTGQHYDRDMSDVFFEELGIPSPDCSLDAGGGSHAQQTARIMERYETVCLEDKPDLIIVVGDVNSTLACSIVAKKLLVKVAHVEAGLRSGDMDMPEEINRVVTDAITDYFFVTEKSGVESLLREGKKEQQIHFVGHVMIDNLLYQVEKLKQTDPDSIGSSELKQQFPEYGTITLHRPSNVDSKESLQDIMNVLGQISEDLPLIFPVHPRTRANIEKFNIQVAEGIKLTTPLSYMDFLNLWKDSRIMLTDSGGLQEETTALGVPCVTIRENTERPITIEEGTNVLAGTDPAVILAESQKIFRGEGKTGRIPELWDGKAAIRIVDILESALS